MLRALRRTTRDLTDRGASAVEYGLMVAAIGALIVGTVFGLGSLVAKTFDHTCSAINQGANRQPAAGCLKPAPGGGGWNGGGGDNGGGWNGGNGDNGGGLNGGGGKGGGGRGGGGWGGGGGGGR